MYSQVFVATDDLERSSGKPVFVDVAIYDEVSIGLGRRANRVRYLIQAGHGVGSFGIVRASP